MSRITATTEDPAKPGGAEDWRPTPTPNLEAKQRDEFLKSWGAEEPAAKGKPAAPEPDDDDEDLDDSDEDDLDDDDEEEVVTKKPAPKAKAKPVEKAEPEPDDDSDLDETDEDEKPDADPVAAKAMAKVQKQEQRMRQQFAEKEARWQAEQTKAREELQAERTAAAEAKSALERLKARVKADPATVLEELGVDDWDYTAKQAYTRSKAGSDPANKEVAARLQAERELKSKLSDVEKKLADREKAEAEALKNTEMRTKVDSYLSNAVKSAATVKAATLTQKMAAADPDYARSRFAEAAARLYKGGSDYPNVREVIVEVEKSERAMLRRYGINPRTLAAGSAPVVDAAKKPNGKAKKAADDDELRRPSKEELLAEDWSG